MSSKDASKKEKKDKKDKEKKEKKDKKAKAPEISSKSIAPTPAPATSVTPGGPTAPASAAREPQAGEQSVVDGLLTVRVIPECPYVLKGVNSSLPVVVELVTGERADRKARAPLSLAIVLDKSGSMSGSKLEQSKHAVAEVIRNLSKGDVVHFIAYDTQVSVVFENGNPLAADDLIKLVKGVAAGSSTFLSGGLEKGGEILKKNLKPGHLNKIFVFSDGLANHGLTDDNAIFGLTKKIHDEGIAVSAFGIGADFSEATMRGIAEYGSGHYFYLNEPGNIPKYVAKALNDSLMVLGTDAVLKMRGRGPAVVKQVYDHPDLVKGAQLKDLRESNLRQITAVLSVTPSAALGAQEEVLAWELSYNTAEKATKTVKGVFTVQFTDDDAKLATKNDEVTVAVAMQEAAAKDVEVTALVSQGKFDEAFLMKGLSLEALRDVASKDKKGFIPILIKRAEAHLADIKARKDPVRIAKAMNYDGYLQRRASVCAMTEIAIASDSAVIDNDSPPASPVPFVPGNRQRRLS